MSEKEDIKMPNDTNNKLDAVIAKVKKLQALGAKNNQPNEMIAALAAAERLIQEYRLTSAQLDASNGVSNVELVDHTVYSAGRRTKWREELLSALCLQYGCAFFVSSGRNGGSAFGHGREGSSGSCSYTVVGTQSDIDILDHMFNYLEKECIRLGKLHSKGQGVRYGVAWLNGCAKGVAAQYYKLQEGMRAAAKAAQEAETSGVLNTPEVAKENAALAVLDKRADTATAYMNKKYKLGTAAVVKGANHFSAQMDGYGVGKNISLNQALKA